VELLQAPGPRLDLDALEGQVVVLELWATWCLPCVEAIPHLNELEQRFAGQGVTFVSITDEPRQEILAFLEKTPMRGWIGLHAGELPLASLGLRGLPATALLGRDGQLLGLTHPEHLKAEHLEAALRGERPDLPPPPARRPAGVDQRGDPTRLVYLARLERAAEDEESYGQPVDGGYVSRGSSLESLLSFAYQTPPAGIRIQAPLPEGRWNFELKLPAGQQSWDRVSAVMQAELLTGLGLQASRVTEDAPGLVLAVDDRAKLEGCQVTDTVHGSSQLRPDGLRVRSQPVKALARMLEHLLAERVVDETNLEGRFDFNLPIPFDPSARPATAAVDAVLREHAGLSLKEATRSLEFIVLTPLPAAR